MRPDQAIELRKTVVVLMAKGIRQYKAAIRLGNALPNSRNFIDYENEQAISIVSADDISSSYGPQNWLSAALSGVFYTFRTLRMARKQILLEDFSGVLGADDMDAVASGFAHATAILLADHDLELDLQGWSIDLSTHLGGDSSEIGDRDAFDGINQMSSTDLLALMRLHHGSLPARTIRKVHDIAIQRLASSPSPELQELALITTN